MGKGFDLGAMLKEVSKLDTNREQIEYISLIDEDPNNFHQLTGIEELADNIFISCSNITFVPMECISSVCCW